MFTPHFSYSYTFHIHICTLHSDTVKEGLYQINVLSTIPRNALKCKYTTYTAYFTVLAVSKSYNDPVTDLWL